MGSAIPLREIPGARRAEPVAAASVVAGFAAGRVFCEPGPALEDDHGSKPATAPLRESHGEADALPAQKRARTQATAAVAGSAAGAEQPAPGAPQGDDHAGVPQVPAAHPEQRRRIASRSAEAGGKHMIGHAFSRCADGCTVDHGISSRSRSAAPSVTAALEESFDLYSFFGCADGLPGETSGAAAMPTEPESGRVSESSDDVSGSEDSDGADAEDELYFSVRHLSEPPPGAITTEMDLVQNRCRRLRELLRLRLDLPLRADGATLAESDLNSGTRLPLCSCPFKGNSRGPCNFHTSDRTVFLHRVAGSARGRACAEEIGDICSADLEWMTNLDYVAGAIAVAERGRWPLRGLSTTRRSLNLLAQRYNDETTQCLCCFICARLRATCKG